MAGKAMTSAKSGRPVTLKHLAARLAADHELTKRAGEAILGDLVSLITKHLKKGERIRIAGFGILQVRARAARMGRNPATGEAIKIKAPGQALEDGDLVKFARTPNTAAPSAGADRAAYLYVVVNLLTGDLMGACHGSVSHVTCRRVCKLGLELGNFPHQVIQNALAQRGVRTIGQLCDCLGERGDDFVHIDGVFLAAQRTIFRVKIVDDVADQTM